MSTIEFTYYFILKAIERFTIEVKIVKAIQKCI